VRPSPPKQDEESRASRLLSGLTQLVADDALQEIPESWYFKFREYVLQKIFKKKKSDILEEDVRGMLFAFLNRTRFKYQARTIA
jgi:hypothetical protein